MRAAKVQASWRIRAVSPEPPLLAHTSSESRGTVRQKARSLAPLNGWAWAVTICHGRMLKDTNLLDWAHITSAAAIVSQYAKASQLNVSTFSLPLADYVQIYLLIYKVKNYKLFLLILRLLDWKKKHTKKELLQDSVACPNHTLPNKTKMYLTQKNLLQNRWEW